MKIVGKFKEADGTLGTIIAKNSEEEDQAIKRVLSAKAGRVLVEKRYQDPFATPNRRASLEDIKNALKILGLSPEEEQTLLDELRSFRPYLFKQSNENKVASNVPPPTTDPRKIDIAGRSFNERPTETSEVLAIKGDSSGLDKSRISSNTSPTPKA